MIAAALLLVLQTDALPRVGDVRTLERTCRWLNKAEEIDYAQIERYRMRVTESKPDSITVEIERQFVSSLLEGERVPSDPVENPDKWTQKFHPKSPAALAWAGTRDKVEARLDQLTLFYLPATRTFKSANPTKHEIDDLQVEAGSALRFQSPTFQATGTWTGDRPWVNMKVQSKGQFLPNSSFRGDLTLETKWLAPTP